MGEKISFIDLFGTELELEDEYAREQLADETAARTEDVAVLEARMDTFTALPAGSTAGDAELTDIRVGANGVTYANAGDAVRAQAFRPVYNASPATSEPIKGFYVHDEATDTDGVAKLDVEAIDALNYGNIQNKPENCETYTLTLNPGYLSEVGTISTPSVHQEVYTNFLETYPTNKVFWRFKGDRTTHPYWVAYCLYDKFQNLVGFRQVPVATVDHNDEVSGTITIPENIYYIRFSYRTFGISNVFETAQYVGTGITEKVSLIESEGYTNVANSKCINRRRSAYVRYSDGAITGSGSYLNVYTVRNKGLKHVKVSLYATDSNSAAIAFYSTDGISTGGYIQASSLRTMSGQNTYEADVPDNCEFIAFTHRTDYPSSVNGEFAVYVSTAEAISCFPDLFETLDEVDTPNLEALVYHRTGQYIRYSDGDVIGSGGYMRWYSFENNNFRKVKTTTYSSDTIPAAIAFYTTDEPNASGYISDASVRAYDGWYSYEAEVPENCKIIVITTRTDYMEGTGEVSIKLIGSDVAAATWLNMETFGRVADELQTATNTLLGGRFKPCYDHLFVNKTGNNVVIPHESLYHVRLSRRFGYNAIEANVYPTSDGVYIVNHLSNGKFGGYFHHVDGETDISDIGVSTVTWAWIVENVRYNSTIPKYRTRPCTLQEFLGECKQQNLIPFLGRSNDAAVIAIANEIMGVDNYIAYSGTRSLSPSAPIYHWAAQTTKANIMAYCESIGAPFIYGMANPTDFTDEELADIVATLHEHGYYIGTSYADYKWHKYQTLGFDFNGTQALANRIDVGNLHNISSIFSFDGFTYSSATETDGVLTFETAGTIVPNIPDTTYELCGIDIEVWFNGQIELRGIGDIVATDYNSDGTYPFYMSIPIVNGSPKFLIIAKANTTVYDIKFKASVF